MKLLRIFCLLIKYQLCICLMVFYEKQSGLLIQLGVNDT